jgi:hypothetical protein
VWYGVVLEPLKEAVEAWLHRVRAPILGYTLLAGLVINWKPLWALLFADVDVFSKFLYFDLRTDYWTLIVLPLLVGVLSALVTPWIALAGAYMVRLPARLQVELQEDARHEAVIRKIKRQAEEEAARENALAAKENALIERAKRDAAAGDVDPEAAQALKRARAEAESNQEVTKRSLSDLDKSVILFMGMQSGPVSPIMMDPTLARVAFEPVLPDATPQRIKVELQDALERLRALDLTNKDHSGSWSLTSKGYEEYDRLSKSS